MINIELKAKCHNLDELRTLVHKAGGEYKTVMHQRDTYFNTPDNKRLKLRVFDNEDPKLVSYVRNDTAKSKESSWEAIVIRDPDNFRNIMEQIYGIFVEVIKSRELWMIKHTRVHLDIVEDLGTFMELETVLNGVDREEGMKEHLDVIKALNLKKDDYLEKSYSDIIIESKLKLF